MKIAQLLFAAVAALPSCMPVPVVLDGGTGELVLEEFPRGTELVELEIDDGAKLRGVFVPAPNPDAPIVLHLLRSGGSVTFGRDHEVLTELAELGVSSLMLDYRGVGASGGSRSSANLESDALALYRETLRRVGGDENRVFIRATSLGSLATAQILESGARPAGVSIVVPVRSETMMQNFLKRRMPDFIRFLAQLPFTNPIDVDILKEIRNSATRLVVHPAAQDYYLPGEEMDWMRAAVRDAGGLWVPVEGSHYDIAIRSRRMFPAERPLFESAVPVVAQASAALED